MNEAYLVLIGGGVLAALIGLLGIYLTQRENSPILELLNEDELRSYRIQRLMTEGIAFCSLGGHSFRPSPGASTTVCEECLPPDRSAGKWEAHTAMAHPVQRLNFGRAYTPVSSWWPELYESDDKDE